MMYVSIWEFVKSMNHLRKYILNFKQIWYVFLGMKTYSCVCYRHSPVWVEEASEHLELCMLGASLDGTEPGYPGAVRAELVNLWTTSIRTVGPGSTLPKPPCGGLFLVRSSRHTSEQTFSAEQQLTQNIKIFSYDWDSWME